MAALAGDDPTGEIAELAGGRLASPGSGSARRAGDAPRTAGGNDEPRRRGADRSRPGAGRGRRPSSSLAARGEGRDHRSGDAGETASGQRRPEWSVRSRPGVSSGAPTGPTAESSTTLVVPGTSATTTCSRGWWPPWQTGRVRRRFARSEDRRATRAAVGAITCYDVTTAIGVVRAAEARGDPVLLLASEASFRSPSGRLLLPALLAVGAEARVPACVQLDHVDDGELIDAALAAGAGAVMADGSKLPANDNASFVASVRARAPHAGVEAELGHVEGGEDVADPAEAGSLTDPDEAAWFVAATGCDCLAVSIGNVHGRYARAPELDWERLRAIRERVDVPLSLHGASGILTPTSPVRSPSASPARSTSTRSPRALLAQLEAGSQRRGRPPPRRPRSRIVDAASQQPSRVKLSILGTTTLPDSIAVRGGRARARCALCCYAARRVSETTKPPRLGFRRDGRYWARTSDPQACRATPGPATLDDHRRRTYVAMRLSDDSQPRGRMVARGAFRIVWATNGPRQPLTGRRASVPRRAHDANRIAGKTPETPLVTARGRTNVALH